MRSQARMHPCGKDSDIMKSHIIINFRDIFLGLVYVALAAFSGFLVIHEPSFLGVLSFIVMTALAVFWYLISPYCIRITEQNVTIYYAFGKRLFARWEEIREIQKYSHRILLYYKFVPMRGATNFRNGSFPRSIRLRKLIEKYWFGTIR